MERIQNHSHCTYSSSTVFPQTIIRCFSDQWTNRRWRNSPATNNSDPLCDLSVALRRWRLVHCTLYQEQIQSWLTINSWLQTTVRDLRVAVFPSFVLDVMPRGRESLSSLFTWLNNTADTVDPSRNGVQNWLCWSLQSACIPLPSGICHIFFQMYTSSSLGV